MPLANQLVPGVGGGAGDGGGGLGKGAFSSLGLFLGSGVGGSSEGATAAAAAAGSSGGVGKSCEAAAGSCAGWRAAPSCGRGSGRCALGGALPRARRAWRTGAGSGEDEGGAVAGCGGPRAEQDLLAPQSRDQVGREKALRARGERGMEGTQPAATTDQAKEAERACSGPRAPGWLGAEWPPGGGLPGLWVAERVEEPPALLDTAGV